MLEVEPIHVEHKDVIHDVVYDYYGRRMATCSSDQTIKIWNEEDDEKWVLASSWKAHSGAIWRASWSHPEFGQIIATCSFDRTAIVWQEVIDEQSSTQSAPSARRWQRRTTLTEARKSVNDLEFAPKYCGLQLATVSSDGTLRIYEASDITNLTHWTVAHELNSKLSLSCLSWNKSTYMLPQLLTVGSDESATLTGKVLIYGYSDNARTWMKIETINEITEPVADIAFAPNPGRSFHTLAVASKDLYIINIRNVTDAVGNVKLQTVKFNEHNCPVSRVCWNKLGNMLLSTGDDGCVRVWRLNYQKTWKCAAVLRADGRDSSARTSAAATETKFVVKGSIRDAVRHVSSL